MDVHKHAGNQKRPNDQNNGHNQQGMGRVPLRMTCWTQRPEK